MSSAILIYRGALVDPFDLRPQDIDLRSMIHSLSMINRYSGHTMRPLSVAEHTVKLSQVVPTHLVRAALLHDMNESLTNDLPHPFKSKLPDYVAFEETVQRKIFDKFRVPWEHMDELKPFDRRMGQDEMEQIFLEPFNLGLEPLGITVEFWSWQRAKQELGDACMEAGLV